MSDSSRSKLQKYLANRLEILEPVAAHGAEAILLAMIVHATALGLRLVLPPDYYEAIHTLELLFYIALSGSLALYTFLVFCFSLSVQFIVSARRSINLLTQERDDGENTTKAARSVAHRRAVRQLPKDREQTDLIELPVKEREKV